MNEWGDCVQRTRRIGSRAPLPDYGRNAYDRVQRQEVSTIGFRRRREGQRLNAPADDSREVPPVSTPSGGSGILVEISPGELLDKVTILEIKRARVTDPGKLRHVE